MSETTNISSEAKHHEATKALRKLQELKEPSLTNDFAFLTTHTVACFLTDFLTIPGSSWLSKHTELNWENGVFNYKLNFKEEITSAQHKKKGAGLEEWALGEIIGDIAAIPITVGLQKMFPEVMGFIGKPLETVFGGYYRNSAEKAADKWAERFDIEIGSQEHYEYKEAHYQKEIAHLPQVAVWTATSMLGNAFAQKVIAPGINSKYGTNDSYGEIMVNSIGGKVITALAANIPRLLAPHSVDHIEHELGEFVDRHVSPKKQNITNIYNDGVITPKQQLLLQS